MIFPPFHARSTTQRLAALEVKNVLPGTETNLWVRNKLQQEHAWRMKHCNKYVAFMIWCFYDFSKNLNSYIVSL